MIFKKNIYFNFGLRYLALPIIFFLIGVNGNAYALPLYYTFGMVQVGIGGDGLEREKPTSSETSISDGETWLDGVSLANADSGYYGSLETGEVGALAVASNGQLPSGEWREAMAETMVGIYDTLYFTIPAGTYPDGISVSANGHVEGIREDSKWGESQFYFDAYLGDGFFEVDGPYTPAGNAHLDVINENFILTDQLLSPGTTLSSDTVIARRVSLTLAPLIASTYMNGGLNWPPQYEGTSASVDFYNTAGLYQINTPSGVTWSSASGAFLSSQPTPVPEPSSLLLLSSGLGWLFIWRRKRRSVA